MNGSPHLQSSCLRGAEHYPDKIRAVYPGLGWEGQLIYAEQIGMGAREYELVDSELGSGVKG